MVAQREPFYYGDEGNDQVFNEEWKRPRVIGSITPRFPTAEGMVYATIGFDEHRRVREVFIRTGKMGETRNADMTALGKVMSYALQLGADPLQLIERLQGITSTPIWHEGVLIKSAEDGLAKELSKFIKGHYDDEISRFFGGAIGGSAEAVQSPAPEPTPLKTRPTR